VGKREGKSCHLRNVEWWDVEVIYDPNERGFENFDWMQVAQDRIQLWPIVNSNRLQRPVWRREFIICWCNQWYILLSCRHTAEKKRKWYSLLKKDMKIVNTFLRKLVFCVIYNDIAKLLKGYSSKSICC
jgi:hypothetical protein